MKTDRGNRPVISVVTVVWNNLGGLELTCESLQAQTYHAIEHIVVDGSSTDGTVRWLETYSPPFGLHVLSERDEGLYDAMNKGLALASGDLLLFLNGGDTLTEPDVLERVAADWIARGWAWAYGRINYVNDERAVLSTFAADHFNGRRVELARTFVPHPATFVGREVRGDLRFDLQSGLSADQEFLLRIARESEPATLRLTITNFLIGGAYFLPPIIDEDELANNRLLAIS